MGNSAISKIQTGSPAYVNTFVDGDLTAGVLTVTHNLNAQYLSVTVYNNNDLIIIPDDVDATGVNACDIDLTSYGTLTGTWRVVILDTGGTWNGTAAAAQDLSLSGQAAEDFAVYNGSSWVAQGGTEKIAVISLANKDMTQATGTIGYTGFGFKPSAAMFIACINGVSAQSHGFDDGNNPEGIAINSNGAATPEATPRCIRLDTGASDSQTALVSSFDADGLTLSWTKAGSPTGSGIIRCMAFR